MGRGSGILALLLSAFLMASQLLPMPQEPVPNERPGQVLVPPTPLPTAEPPAMPEVVTSSPTPTPTPAAARVPIVLTPPSPSAEQPYEFREPAHPAYVSGRDRLYILMLHQVTYDGAECNNWTITESQLRSYLQWLDDHGYVTVLPSQIAAGEDLPQRAVLLTFDDGYVSGYHTVYPILQEFGAKAVISVVVHYQDEEAPSFLSWSQCREMVQSGLVEIGSHTYDRHGEDRGLRRQEGESQEDYEARIFPDIDKSVQRLEEELGVPVTFFAYPNGLTDAWSNEYLTHRFSMTVTTTYGVARLSKSLYRLPRFTINSSQPVWAILPK